MRKLAHEEKALPQSCKELIQSDGDWKQSRDKSAVCRANHVGKLSWKGCNFCCEAHPPPKLECPNSDKLPQHPFYRNSLMKLFCLCCSLLSAKGLCCVVMWKTYLLVKLASCIFDDFCGSTKTWGQ
eukprot:6472449-Amphidinium_carterae.1